MIETAVEKFYAQVQLPAEQAATLAANLREHLSGQHEELARDREHAQRRLATLEAEREKLLQAHPADAVPLDLLRREQHRIAAEIEQAEQTLSISVDRIEATERGITLALDLAVQCQRLYLTSPPHLRRMLNQRSSTRCTSSPMERSREHGSVHHLTGSLVTASSLAMRPARRTPTLARRAGVLVPDFWWR